MYREMWERLREEIYMALDEGHNCGYDNPNNENFNKFYVFDKVSEKMYRIENGVKERRREGRQSDFLAKTFNLPKPIIKNVVFNDPATVVMWSDGTKTVVKCQPGDVYSKETGLALCIAKKFLGNKSNFNEIFKQWIPEETEPVDETIEAKVRELIARLEEKLIRKDI